MAEKKKPVVGFFDLTGCNGCLLSFLFNEDELLDLAKQVDIVNFRFFTEKKEDTHFDLVFVEGLVAANDDLERLKKLREKTDKLVAFGACACTGCVPAYRNFIDQSKYAYLVYEKAKEISDLPPQPIGDHIKVDFFIPGCPPDKKQIATFIKDILLGKRPYDYDKPVCFECRLNENRCLLDDKKMCFGPITRGGCNSVCTNGKFECWGCRGPTPDADIPLMIRLLEQKGFTKEHIKQRLRTFSGMPIEKPQNLKVVKPQKIKKKEKKPAKQPKIKPVKVSVKAKKKAVKAKPAKKASKSKNTAKKSAKKAKPKPKKQKAKKTAKKIVKKSRTKPKKTAKKIVKKAPKKVQKPKTAAKKAVKKSSSFFSIIKKKLKR